MKCTIPEISWHNRDPVLSVDISPIYNEFYKLASGGTDCHVLIWSLRIRENGAVDVDIICDLTRHQKSVNVVRWSPTGLYLATGDDDANIIIWNLRTDNIPLLDEETGNEETWVVTKVLRGHKEDVYDISWSPNELKLISGSIDNTAILWDFTKGQSEYILSDHKGFVQGVTWDPKGEYIATICSDRTCRVFDSSGKCVKAMINRGQIPVSDSNILFNQEIKYFHDDTFKSYFRRLNFSPDGNLLITPSGCIETANEKVTSNATYIFAISSLIQPIAIIPSPKQVTIAVRCCPLLFELRTDANDPIVDLPYRMIIAVATESDVILYDTQQVTPFAHFQKIHYTRITDLTWSSDGLLLIASSTDGFCTLITFETDELGYQYTKEESETEDSILNVSGCEELGSLENKDKEALDTKKPSMLEKWAIRTPKVCTTSSSSTPDKATSDDTDMPVNIDKKENETKEIKKIAPKRIAPIRIGDSSKKDDVINATPSKNEDSSNTKESASPDVILIDDNEIPQKVSSKKEENVINGKTKHKTESVKNCTPNKKNTILKFFQVASADKDPLLGKTEPPSKIVISSSKTNMPKESSVNDSSSSSQVIDLCDSDSNMSVELHNTPKQSKEKSRCGSTEKENIQVIPSDTSDLKQNVTTESKDVEKKVNIIKTPRRIPFVTLGSPKRKKKE